MNKFKIILFTILSFGRMLSCSDDNSDFTGADNFIASFALEESGTKYYAAITTDSIVMHLPQNVVFTGNVTPLVAISENATISPAPSSITNWNVNMEFTIKSYNGKEKVYKYAVLKTAIVHEGNVTLQTQADVDAFAESGITAVEGNLTIATIVTGDTIRSLAALSNLKSVKYELNIGSNFLGNNLQGLENLESASTITIGSDYYTKMKELTQVALPALKKVNNALTLTAPSAKTIELPLLESVGGNLTINNDSLYTCNINSLQSIGGDLGVWYSKNIVEFKAPKLKRAGNVTFAADTKLVEMDFPLLESIDGRFYIGSMSEVKVINMPLLVTVGSMDLSASKSETVNFKSLAISNGNLSLSYLKGDIDLSSLTEVKGNFYLPSMTNTLKLGALASVEGTMSFAIAEGVQQVSGLEKLTSVQSLTISGNSNSTVTSLLGLESLVTVVQGLSINTFPNLATLSGLSALTSVGSLTLSEVGLTHLSSANLPPQLKNIGSLRFFRSPIIEIDIRGLNLTELMLVYLSSYTDKTKVVGDNTVLERIYIEDVKTIELTGIDEVKSFRIASNGARGYGVEVTGLKRAGSAELYHGRDYLNIPDLESVTGNLKIYDNTTLPNLKEVGSITCGSYWIGNNLPELVTVNGDAAIATGYGANSTEKVNMPKLATVEGKLTIKGYSTSATYQNTKLAKLDDLSSLTKVASIQILNNQVLTDYSGLKNVIPSITASDWETGNNGYNPSFLDMQEGRYVK